MGVVLVGAFEDGATIGVACVLKVFAQTRAADPLGKANVIRIIQTVDHCAIASIEASLGTRSSFPQSAFPTDQEGVLGHGAQCHTRLARCALRCNQALGFVEASGLTPSGSAATGALSRGRQDTVGAQLKLISFALNSAFGFALCHWRRRVVLLTPWAGNNQSKGGEDDNQSHQVSGGKAIHVFVICHTRQGCSTSESLQWVI